MGADGFLRWKTSANVKLGPFTDADNAVSAETALAGASEPSVNLTKNAGTLAARAAAASVLHDANGWYDCVLNSVDANTLGRLKAEVSKGGTHLPVWHTFTVLPSNAYDALVAGSDVLQAHVTEESVGIAALPTSAEVGAIVESARAALATDIGTIPTSAEVATIVESARADLSANISGVVDLVWDEPQSNHVGSGTMGWSLSNAAAGAASPAAIADAVWDEAQADHVAAGSMGAQQSVAAAGGGVTASDIWHYSVSAGMATGQAGKVLLSAATDIRSLPTSAAVGAIVESARGSLAGAVSDVPNQVWHYSLSAGMFENQAGYTLRSAAIAAGTYGGPDALTIADQVWDELQSEHVGPGSFGAQMSAAVAGAGASPASVAEATWHYSVSAGMATGVAGEVLLSAAGGAGATPFDIWHYSNTGAMDAGTAGRWLRDIEAVRHTIQSVSAAAAQAFVDYDPPTKAEVDTAVESARANLATTLPTSAEVGTIVESARAALATNIANLNDPTASAVADVVWDEPQSNHVGSASMGAQLSAAAAGGGVTAGDIWHYSVSAAMVSGQAGYVLQSAAANAGATVSGAVSAADISDIADEVWNRGRSGHTASGTMGETMTYFFGSGDTPVDEDFQPPNRGQCWRRHRQRRDQGLPQVGLRQREPHDESHPRLDHDQGRRTLAIPDHAVQWRDLHASGHG
jgi:hypothetical protein